MAGDPLELEAQKRRANRSTDQIKQYQEHLDQLEAEKKEKTGTIAGKKAKILPSETSSVHNLFSKITKTP